MPAKAKAKAKAKPRAKPERTLEQQMADYQAMMEESQRQFKETVNQANAQLAELVAMAQPEKSEQKIKPEAQWTEANGSQYLVLNKEAATFFTAIFSQLGDLVPLIQSAISKGKAK